MRSAVPLMAFVFVILAASMFFGPADASEEDDPLPQELYPDYDYIFTPGDGCVLITYKSPTEGGFEWKVREVPVLSDVHLVRWSEMTGDMRVIFDGAQMDDIILIDADDPRPTQKFVSIEFLMTGGHLGSLTLMDTDITNEHFLGDDYRDMFNPIQKAQIEFRSGHLTCFNPTHQMIHIDSMEVSIGAGMTVDRFYTSGENGRYSNLSVELLGGNVGYMANQKARIGYLTYYLAYGKVDYLALGADTEFGGNYSLSRANTSYVAADVDAYIDPSVEIQTAIVGGGLFEIPNILWNGEELQDAVVRNIAIEAKDQVLRGDVFFINDRRDKAYQFSDYVFGTSPKATPVSSMAWLDEGGQMSTYGPEGIWNGYSDLSVNTGTSVFLGSVFAVPEKGSLDIDMGGKLVSANRLVLYGTLNVLGEAVNNHLIDVREDGIINGKVTGIGLIADYITSQSKDSAINVMSEYESVLITQDDDHDITEVTAMLGSGSFSVTIRSMYEGMGLIDDGLLISLRPIPVSESFHSGYELFLNGIDANTLTSCVIDVTVPVAVPWGKVPVVYLYDEDDKDYESVPVESTDRNNITFRTTEIGVFSVMFEDANSPSPDAPRNTDNVYAVSLLILGIGLTVAAMAFISFQFRK